MTRFAHMLFACFLGVALLGSTSTIQAQTPTISTADRFSITEAIVGVGLYADIHDWDRLTTLLAPEVTTDYTSLFGGEVVTSGRDVLVGQWKSMLPGFDATQHLITNIVIDPSGEEILARSHVRATHWIGGRSWTVGGIYMHRLVRSSGGWQVRSLTIRRLYEEGDRGLVAEASERMKANTAR